MNTAAQVQREVTATEEHREMVKGIVDSAIRLDSDVNGNPRYYIPVFMFTGKDGKWYRPAYCNKYRGKRYGAGWAFQSYNLKRSIEQAIEIEFGVQF